MWQIARLDAGMLGEAVSEPSFHASRGSSPPVPDTTEQHDAPDMDPSAHTRTWDSAANDMHSPGPLFAAQHAASVALTYPPPAGEPIQNEHRLVHGPEPAVTSPFAEHASGPSQAGALATSRMGFSQGSLPQDAAGAAEMRHSAPEFHEAAHLNDAPYQGQDVGSIPSMPNGTSSIPERGQGLETGPGVRDQTGRSSLGVDAEPQTAYQIMFQGQELQPPPDEEEIPGTAVGSYSSTPEAGALSFMPFQDATSTFRKRARGRPRVTFQQTKDMWDGQDEESGHLSAGRVGRQPPAATLRGASFSGQEQESVHRISTSRAHHRLAKLFTTPSTPAHAADREPPV